MKTKHSYSEKDLGIIRAARKVNKDKRVERRLHALELQASGKRAKEISTPTGLCPAYVSQLMAKYRDGGIEAITGNHYGGNRRKALKKKLNCLSHFVKEDQKANW